MHRQFRQTLDLLVEQENTEFEYCPDLLARYQGDMVKLGKRYTQDVWEVLRNGTEDEFSAICNSLPEIGGEFDNDEKSREIMRIAKRRLSNAQNYENLLLGIKSGFGASFNRFWNETEIADPAAKARAFSRAANHPPMQ